MLEMWYEPQHLYNKHRCNNRTDTGFIKQASFNNAINNATNNNILCYIRPIIKYKRQF